MAHRKILKTTVKQTPWQESGFGTMRTALLGSGAVRRSLGNAVVRDPKGRFGPAASQKISK